VVWDDAVTGYNFEPQRVHGVAGTEVVTGHRVVPNDVHIIFGHAHHAIWRSSLAPIPGTRDLPWCLCPRNPHLATTGCSRPDGGYGTSSTTSPSPRRRGWRSDPSSPSS